MSIAAQESNNGMNDMNFMVSTSAVYQFWLYDLCDIYIVRTMEMLG